MAQVRSIITVSEEASRVSDVRAWVEMARRLGAGSDTELLDGGWGLCRIEGEAESEGAAPRGGPQTLGMIEAWLEKLAGAGVAEDTALVESEIALDVDLDVLGIEETGCGDCVGDSPSDLIIHLHDGCNERWVRLDKPETAGVI